MTAATRKAMGLSNTSSAITSNQSKRKCLGIRIAWSGLERRINGGPFMAAAFERCAPLRASWRKGIWLAAARANDLPVHDRTQFAIRIAESASLRVLKIP